MSNFITTGLGTIPFYGINKGTYTVRVNGSPVFCIAGSLKIDLSIGRRSQASFNLHTDTNTHFLQYQQVKIYDNNGILVFSGYITNPKEQKPGFQNSLIHTITATDQHFLADKRIIAKVYTNMTAGQIVQDIVTNYLAIEGVSLNTSFINDGLIPSLTLYPSTTLYPSGNVGVIPSVTFSYCTIAAALDQLVTTASSAGVPYYWMIDQNKNLYFQPYTGITNSTVIDGTWVDNKTNVCTVQRQNAKYRNKEWITGGVSQTAQIPVTITTDGQTTSWTMGYALASAPTIALNGTGQTVGLKGTTGAAFYWQQGDPAIVQDSALKIPASQKLTINYVGQYPSITVTQDLAQIAAQAAIDGTSGIIEAVDDYPALTDLTSAVTQGARLLGLYAVQGTILQLTTQVPGFTPGQLVDVDLPMHGLNTQMLIESVSIADSDNLNIWYTINAVIGPYDTTWVSFFSQLFTQQQPASAVSVGSTTITNITPVVSSTTLNSAVTRFRLTSGPQPPTNTSRDAAVRFLLRVGGSITTTTQAFTASFGTAPTATVTATVASSSSGGGTGGGNTSGRMFIYKFGDDSNSSESNTNQYVAGTNLLLYWSQISPSKGVYNWSVIDNLMKPWTDNGKKIILRIASAGHAGWAPPYSAMGTPAWVFAEGVQKVTETDGAVYPAYWNTSYLNELNTFIQAVGARYDGNPNITYIQISTGDGGEARVSTNSSTTLAKWQAVGYTDQVWRDTTFKIVSFYTSAFKKTPLCWMGDKTFIGNSGAPFNEGNMVLWCTGQSNGLGTSPFTPSGSLPRLWLQNNGIGTNSAPDPKWLLTTIGCEQLAKTATTGDTLDGDMAAMLKYGATYALIFHSDILASANQSTLAKYYKL